MRSLHIVYVEMGYPRPGWGGGAGTYVQLVGRELARRGHKVSIVAAWYPECGLVAEDEGLTIYRPRLKGSLHWYASKIPILKTGALAFRALEHGWQLYRFLERLHRETPIDIAEFSEGGDFWHAIFPSFPYLCHLHGSRYTFLKQAGKPVHRADWYQRRLGLFFIRRAKWVLSPSQAMADVVEEENDQPFRKKSVIPYPLDPQLANNQPSANGANHPGKIVMFAARNDPVKGGDVLLQAIPLVRQSIPNVEFRIFGYQPNGQAVPEGVSLYPFLPKAELLAHYHQADLCVIPSRWDNSPNTVYEAMAAGKAVVASRVGGIPELVVDGETCLLVEPNDPQGLAAALVNLLSDNSRRLTLGQKGRKYIQHLGNLQANVDQRFVVYQKVLAESI
ncbi:MAG: glycosyltransferase family 4 protein [Anaerolineales bacterium]|nr:glycosyltransferase family 4 protein [Chloroflexota bacterium]MBL6980713.1 glycosyltransferase family 4 protein [Anaerolineales bacterium]